MQHLGIFGALLGGYLTMMMFMLFGQGNREEVCRAAHRNRRAQRERGTREYAESRERLCVVSSYIHIRYVPICIWYTATTKRRRRRQMTLFMSAAMRAGYRLLAAFTRRTRTTETVVRTLHFYTQLDVYVLRVCGVGWALAPRGFNAQSQQPPQQQQQQDNVASDAGALFWRGALSDATRLMIEF